MSWDDDILIHGLQGQSRDNELSSDYLAGEEILGHEEILGAIAAASSRIKGTPAFQTALANKLARIAWKLMATGATYAGRPAPTAAAGPI
jgi:transposase